MMKKIRTIRDIENEKLKLRVKQLELEKKMNQSWSSLKNNLSSTDFVRGKQPKESGNNFNTRNTLLNGALNYGASFLSHKLGMIAGKKAEATAEQMLEKLAEKINLLVAKRKRSS